MIRSINNDTSNSSHSSYSEEAFKHSIVVNSNLNHSEYERKLDINETIGNIFTNSSRYNTTRNLLSNMESSTISNDSDGWFELPEMKNFQDFVTLCCSSAIIFGGLVPYIPQYLKIKRSRDSSGFSNYVCLTLLIANILRIMFWFGHPFEKPLLIQSFLMSACMLAMVDICVRAKNHHSSNYQISTIGFGSNLQRRRFQIGKLIDGNDSDEDFREDDVRANESTPICSLLSSHSHSFTPTILEEDESSYGDDPPPSSNPTQPQAHPSSSSSFSITAEANDKINFLRHSSSGISDELNLRNDPELGDSNSLSIQYSHASLMGQTSLSGENDKCSFKNFWNWDDFMSYVKFLALFTISIGIITFLFVNVPLYVEALGCVALITESMLGMPQLFRNHVKKSTRGMSVEMVVLWLSGDLFKTTYYIVRKTPAQFYVCGSIQVIVDVLILSQVFVYRQSIVPYRRLPKTS